MGFYLELSCKYANILCNPIFKASAFSFCIGKGCVIVQLEDFLCNGCECWFVFSDERVSFVRFTSTFYCIRSLLEAYRKVDKHMHKWEMRRAKNDI